MPKISAKDDPRFRKAVKKKIDNEKISLPEAMKLADYTPDEIQDMALQQRIRREVHNKSGGKKPTAITVTPSIMSTVSTLTATPPLKTTLKAKKWSWLKGSWGGA